MLVLILVSSVLKLAIASSIDFKVEVEPFFKFVIVVLIAVSAASLASSSALIAP
jgi:hypothetical protein